MFLQFERRNNFMHVASLSVYDPSTAPGGGVRFKDVLRFFATRVAQFPQFRRRLVSLPLSLDRPYWIESPTIDVEFHVRHIALPHPGDWRQLCIQVARLGSRRLDMSRPPWEITVIEGLDNVEGVPKGAFAIFFKIHHSAIDGMGGVELMHALHDPSPSESSRRPRTRDTWKPEPMPSQWELLGRATIGNAWRPFRVLRALGGALPGAVRAGRIDIERPPTRVPVTRFNAKVSAHRVFDMRKFPLAEIKRIRAALGEVTINDVAMTIVSGALRSYLKAKGELPKESLVGLVPISTRTPEDADAEGNLVTMLASSLRTDIADPVERLQGIHQAMTHTKTYANAIGARKLSDIATAIPGRLQGWAARASARVETMIGTRLMANMLVTNVPGPREPLYFAGAHCVDMFGMAPLGPNMGIANNINSYCGSMYLNFAACREQMPDPELYADGLQQSYQALLDAAVGGTSKKTATRSTPSGTTTRFGSRKRAAAVRPRLRRPA